MKLLSATIASVVGAAAADPATVIAIPAQASPVQSAHIPAVQTVQAVQAVHHVPATTQYLGQQPIYVAAQPVQTGHQVVQLEQQLMRSPQMATMTHLYNIPQTVAAGNVPVTVYQQVPQPVQQPVHQVVRQQVPQPTVVKEPSTVVKKVVVQKEGEVSQQYHKQDDFGNYAYGYANDNSEKQEIGNTKSGQVKGHYTYVDGNGLNRRVDYAADNNGFRAKVDGVKIKREAEAEPEAEAKADLKVEKVQMTSYMKAGVDDQPEGMRMTSYMSNGMPARDMQQQMYVMPRSMRLQSTLPQSDSLMTYYNRPMVYMAMNGPSRGTFTATRTVDPVDSYTMGDRQMINMRTGNGLEDDLEAMRMGGDRHLDMNMRRNANLGRQMDMSVMGMEDSDMFYRGQYLNNNLYRNRLMRNVFKTNPTNFMEIQQFEMKPNYNYRFDF